VAEAGLEDRLAGIDAYALSAAVAEALSGLTWRQGRHTDRPEESALLALMGLAG
jgi:hypothetical protein